jgi:hypothetical protein
MSGSLPEGPGYNLLVQEMGDQIGRCKRSLLIFLLQSFSAKIPKPALLLRLKSPSGVPKDPDANQSLAEIDLAPSWRDRRGWSDPVSTSHRRRDAHICAQMPGTT